MLNSNLSTEFLSWDACKITRDLVVVSYPIDSVWGISQLGKFHVENSCHCLMKFSKITIDSGIALGVYSRDSTCNWSMKYFCVCLNLIDILCNHCLNFKKVNCVVCYLLIFCRFRTKRWNILNSITFAQNFTHLKRHLGTNS